MDWLDDNDVNVASIFQKFDADKSEELTRDELFEGLATCGKYFDSLGPICSI